MSSRIQRRSFLQIIVVTASAPGLLTACGDDETTPVAPVDTATAFPQGLASGDPKPESVILWTRVEPGAASETVSYEVATDEAFSSLVAQGETTVDASTDHTVRLKVEGLSSYTKYFYRFKARGATSVVGQTKTAPGPNDDVNVRFAFSGCQDYNGRYYHSWKALVEEEGELDFVLHLGDYIYETEGDPRFQDPTLERRVLMPDGLEIAHEGNPTFNAALTLTDYRHCYKTYRSDPDLQRAHQLYPFINVWDDHEFADDCWQDHSTHFNEAQGDEKSPERRQDATQAWFEYQPADVVHNPNASFPDDIQIYRNLRYGQHVDLVLSDGRYYRDDHLIPEGPPDISLGKTSLNSTVGSRFIVPKDVFDMREAAAATPPTMLGATQKQWLIDTITASDATWKIWGNQTQLAQHAVDLTSFTDLPTQFQTVFYLQTDQWDGYRTERAEIVAALTGTDNVVSAVSDIHAFYASHIYTDFDNPTTPSLVEFTAAGISSQSIAKIGERLISQSDTLTGFGLLELVPQLDPLIKAASPHYFYADSDANGIAIAEVSATEILVHFLHVGDVLDPADGGIKERVSFRVAAGSNTIVSA